MANPHLTELDCHISKLTPNSGRHQDRTQICLVGQSGKLYKRYIRSFQPQKQFYGNC